VLPIRYRKSLDLLVGGWLARLVSSGFLSLDPDGIGEHEHLFGLRIVEVQRYGHRRRG